MATRTPWATRLPRQLVSDLVGDWPRAHTLGGCTVDECATCCATRSARLSGIRADEPSSVSSEIEDRAIAAAYAAEVPRESLERLELYMTGDLSVADEEMAEARAVAASDSGPAFDAYPTAALRALVDVGLDEAGLLEADADDLEAVADLVSSLEEYDGHDPEVERPVWVADEQAFLGGRLVCGPMTLHARSYGAPVTVSMGVAS